MPADHRQQLQYGYVLHTRPYRDSSKLLEIFTQHSGRVGLVARGVRNHKSRQNAQLEPFIPLLFSWSGKGELRTLTAIEAAGPGMMLPGNRILSGFYMNELIMRLLQRDDPHPELFLCYESAVQYLANKDHAEEAVLREFEYSLMQELGYGLQLEVDVRSGETIQPDLQYCYFPEQGPMLYTGGAQDEHPLISGKSLLAIRDRKFQDQQVLREAKLLMRYLLALHLDNRPLKSRELYWQSRNL